MAFRRWFRKRYPYRYSRYRRRYRRYRYSRKYVNSSSRSSLRMKTNVNATLNCTAGYGDAATGAVVSLFRPLNGTGDTLSAANSPLYRTYCSLYEECKMIGCKVSMAVVSAIGGSDIPSLQIYTAWDRKHGYSEPYYSVSDIKNASTSSVATALNNNVAKLTRSCYASDLMEKATWFDATLDSANANRNSAWYTASLNPTMFCPSFFFFLNSPSLGATKTVSVSISVTYYFAFRNPRYGGGSNSKLVDLGPRAVDPQNDDDGDMDDAAAVPPPILDDMDDIVGDIQSQREEERVPVTARTSSRSTASLNAERRAADRASRRPNV